MNPSDILTEVLAYLMLLIGEQVLNLAQWCLEPSMMSHDRLVDLSEWFIKMHDKLIGKDVN